MHRGWRVAAAGTGINLVLGVLYCWSIFKDTIEASIARGGLFRWNLAQLNDPFSVACLAFAFAMILGGRLQDRFGPRATAFIGGILLGSGFLLVSTSTSYAIWVLGFGVLAGTGIGLCYSTTVPTALRWFSSAQTGLIAGIVVSGFGLAAVYLAPLSRALMGDVGLRASMMYLGTGFLVVVSLLAQFLVNPRERLGGIALPVSDSARDIGFAQLVRTPTAWLIWATFFVGAGTGLMLIGIVAELVRPSLGTSAYIAVVVLALGNASGRLIGGLVSDRFGRRLSLATTLLAQAVFMFLAALIAGAQHAPAIFCLAVVALVGFTFGSLLALYPAVTKDHFGMRHFGSNYAAIFTAWGVGGFVMSHLAQSLYAAAHSHRPACFFACAMLVVSCGLTLLLPDARPASRRSS